MKSNIYVPNSMREAGREIRLALPVETRRLSKRSFLRAWCSLAYLFPGLHPDGFNEPDSGWPPVLKRFAVEAWRRADAGKLGDGELYACDAQWAGLFDRMFIHTREETGRRLGLAASFGRSGDA
jgi:hypothetical protein